MVDAFSMLFGIITSIDPVSGIATVQTTGKGNIPVPVTRRKGKGAWPQVGETWTLSRADGGNFVFDTLLDTHATPPAVYFNRDDPVSVSTALLDALVGLGLLTKVDDPVSYSFSPKQLPTLSTQGDGPSTPDVPEIIPVPVIFGTYNTGGATRSNAAIQRDLTTFLKSSPDIFGLQEMYGSSTVGLRDPIETQLKAAGYQVIRYEQGNSSEWNWIVYRPSVFTVLSQGLQLLTDAGVGGTGTIARYAIWAQLQHLQSHQKLVFINTHMVAPPRYTSAAYSAQQQALYTLCRTLHPKGSIVLVGNLGSDFRNGGQFNSAGYPGNPPLNYLPIEVVWGLIGINYTTFGTWGMPLMDYICRGPDLGDNVPLNANGSLYRTTITFTSITIVRGCLSPHRPVVAGAQIKRLDTDITY